MKQHRYNSTVRWTGNRGSGTSAYRAYDRAHRIEAQGKAPIAGSSDPGFRGDASAWNPEELLVSALSSCHMLWYLHLAADSGIVVTAYLDHAEGIMNEDADGAGRFTAVTLHPHITLARGSDPVQAFQLHQKAHRWCFIANSVNFPVGCEPVIVLEAEG